MTFRINDVGELAARFFADFRPGSDGKVKGRLKDSGQSQKATAIDRNVVFCINRS